MSWRTVGFIMVIHFMSIQYCLSTKSNSTHRTSEQDYYYLTFLSFINWNDKLLKFHEIVKIDDYCLKMDSLAGQITST